MNHPESLLKCKFLYTGHCPFVPNLQKWSQTHLSSALVIIIKSEKL